MKQPPSSLLPLLACTLALSAAGADLWGRDVVDFLRAHVAGGRDGG